VVEQMVEKSRYVTGPTEEGMTGADAIGAFLVAYQLALIEPMPE
jgi:hypothetical protein